MEIPPQTPNFYSTMHLVRHWNTPQETGIHNTYQVIRIYIRGHDQTALGGKGGEQQENSSWSLEWNSFIGGSLKN